MQVLLQDIRYSLRQFLRSPGFMLTALISLALGIGATTAVFSVIYAACAGGCAELGSAEVGAGECARPVNSAGGHGVARYSVGCCLCFAGALRVAGGSDDGAAV